MALVDKLNEKLPYYSIVRYYNYETIEDIDINYYLNSIDLSNFIKDSIGFSKGKVSNDFKKQISSNFEDWLLECHKIMMKGSNDNRSYAGISEIKIDVDKTAGKLRDSNDVHFKFEDWHNNYVFSIGRLYDDKITKGLETFEEWEQEIKKDPKSFTIFQKMPGLNLSEDQELELLDKGFYPYTSGYEPRIFVYPDHKQIKNHLNVMNKFLEFTIEYIDQKNKIGALTNLLTYYEIGARSQAVRGVWNSVLMAQVNEFVNFLGYERIPHKIWDILAFSLESQNFKQDMGSYIICKKRNKDPMYYEK